MAEIIIPLNSPSILFEEHLSIKDNNRILFSGPFGIGKTTFIKDFFSKKVDTLTITLRPINYVVASNEDIYKLIKYDILYQLLEKELIVVEDFGVFNNIEILQNFIPNLSLTDTLPLLKSISEHPSLKYIPMIGATALPILLSIEKLYSKYKKVKSEINANVDEKKIINFLVSSNDLFVLENDFITTTINNALKRINAHNKCTFLIIDDLDRIDPEHIFRLFNIFSTHFDYDNEQANKFSFSKIIFICDIDNIKSIFQSKYGLRTDFNGYLDKFYSTKVFTYGNKEAIQTYIKAAFRQIVKTNHVSAEDIVILSEILIGMLNFNVINLRNLRKINIEKKMEYEDDALLNQIFKTSITEISNFNYFRFTNVCMILSYLTGDIELLIDLLEKCNEINKNKDNKIKNFKTEIIATIYDDYVIPVVYWKSHGFKELPFNISYNDVSKPYQLYKKDRNYHCSQVPQGGHLPTNHLWQHILNAVKIIRDQM